MGFVAFGRDWSASADYDGRQLWRYEAPPLEAVANKRAAFEPPGVIWDLDAMGEAKSFIGGILTAKLDLSWQTVRPARSSND